jgi:hypothetical protein
MGCSSGDNGISSDNASSSNSIIENSNLDNIDNSYSQSNIEAQRELDELTDENCRISSELTFIQMDASKIQRNLEWSPSLNGYYEVDSIARDIEKISQTLLIQGLNLCDWNQPNAYESNLPAEISKQQDLRCNVARELDWVSLDIKQVERDWDSFLFRNSEVTDFNTLSRIRDLSSRLWIATMNLCQ